ncbi:MAG: glycosyltransferase family 39 protein [Bacteroidetes bacterium]|nr:glycosyltransferase family 39 protein [Bacteroidota bacterium]
MEKYLIENQSFPSKRKWLFLILTGGLLFRLAFLFFGGKYYYGAENFQIQGDTYGWIDSIMNLIQHGIYTSDLTVKNAAFFRPPGYAFIIGIFYLLTGCNLDLGLQLLSFSQIILDTVAIWLVYKIMLNISKSEKASLFTSALYATYPFIIVWTPVLYAESLSVFFILSALFFLTKEITIKNLLLSGIFTGMAVLTRLQCIFILPAILLYLSANKISVETIKTKLVPYLIGFGLLYGLWPIRNLIFQDRLVFSQDLRVGKHWSPDYMAFMEYIFAVKTDHQPQYQQIIENKKVEWPKNSFGTTHDSLLLRKTIEQFRVCGTGLSYFKFHAGLLATPIKSSENCDQEIAENFTLLKNNFIKQFPLDYYLLVPLSNLKKGIFKFSLLGDKSGAVKLAASTLFIYRTFLIVLGFILLFVNYKKKWFQPQFGTLAITYFLLWYFFLCFVYRNIEIRYFLQCDILLLFPIGLLIEKIVSKYSRPTKIKKA